MKSIKNKKYILITLAIAFCISLCFFLLIGKTQPQSAVAVGTNLIQNGDFENGLNGWDGGFTFSCDIVEFVKEGEKSLKVKSSTDQTLFTDIKQEITLVGGKKYDLSLYINVFQVNVSTNLEISIAGVKSDKMNLSEWSGWNKINLIVDLTNSVGQINTSLCMSFSATGGKGKVIIYIDDIVLSEKDNLIIQDGATLRTGEKTGIRFSGEVDKDYYDSLVVGYGENNVCAGILVTTKGIYDEISEFSFEGLAGKQFLDMKSLVWKNADDDSKTVYKFDCVMVDIKEKNKTKEFCARAYIKYYDGENYQYVYSAFDATKNIASLQALLDANV